MCQHVYRSCCALLIICEALCAQTTLRWTVDPARPAAADWPVYQGETIRLEPAFVSYGVALALTNATAAMYWQTNGMAAAWWSVPAEIVTGATARVRATWGPTNDCGAARYTYFVAVAATEGLLYRAFGTLTMRASPGATPAILAAPTTLTDALQAWGDAHYDPLGTAQAASNALADAVQAEAQARAAGDTVAMTNWQAVVYSMTNGAALGATALQPSWAATGTVHKADFANEAYQASVALDAGSAAQLAPGVPDKVSLDAATAHIDDPAAHPDIRGDIADATNALVQTYLLGTNAWMSISNAVLTIWRETNGVPAALWSSAESEGGGGVDPAFANAVWDALNTKGDAAWGTRAPDGSANPDPAYMTFINAPAIMHASGFQWATFGAYSVMAESGAVAYESGADGTARWGLDLHTNYVGFVRGGSIIVAAKAESINVIGGGTETGYAEIIYPYTAGDFPSLWHAPALDVPFVLQEGVVWVDNQDGTATVTAPATTPKGFWYATTTAVYDVIFEIRPPARLTGGVIGATNDTAVVYDSTITISSGGKTYRIPAQEVP